MKKSILGLVILACIAIIIIVAVSRPIKTPVSGGAPERPVVTESQGRIPSDGSSQKNSSGQNSDPKQAVESIKDTKPTVGQSANPQDANSVVPAGIPIDGHVQPAEKWGPAEEYNEAYYAKVDPGRIQQTRPLKEGEVLPAIQVAGPGFQWALPGKPCEKPLRVKVPANMPCTFYAEDWGIFQNGKNSITVKAGPDGMAEAVYTAPASMGGSMVLAHSPEAMGIGRFSIKVVSEKELAQIKAKEESSKTQP
jgi:hypothetical protein